MESNLENKKVNYLKCNLRTDNRKVSFMRGMTDGASGQHQQPDDRLDHRPGW